MSTKKNTAAAVVNAVIDNAFVPDMEKKPESEGIRSEQSKKTSDFFAQHRTVIHTPFFEKPTNGIHTVVIDSYDAHSKLFLTLRDVKKNNLWTMVVKHDDFDDFVAGINKYNRDVIGGLDGEAAIDLLMSKPFCVWVQNFTADNGNECYKTYTNRNKYERFARHLAYEASRAAVKPDAVEGSDCPFDC